MIRFLLLVAFVSVGFSADSVFADEPSMKLIAAMIQPESGGDDHAVGDKIYPDGRPRPEADWAYGSLQVRRLVVNDVNRAYQLDYKSKDCLGDRELSIWICRKYIDMYATEKRIGRKPTDEDKARIWNGGPNGWKKSSTLDYWQKVKRELDKMK